MTNPSDELIARREAVEAWVREHPFPEAPYGCEGWAKYLGPQADWYGSKAAFLRGLTTLESHSPTRDDGGEVERDRWWWKPEQGDPFWVLEHAGAYLKNRDSCLTTKDIEAALVFPSEWHADCARKSLHGVNWMKFKPVEHAYVAALSNPQPQAPSEERAREVLASVYEEDGCTLHSSDIREGGAYLLNEDKVAIRAMIRFATDTQLVAGGGE